MIELYGIPMVMEKSFDGIDARKFLKINQPPPYLCSKDAIVGQ